MAKANNSSQVPVHGRFSFNNFLKRFSDTGIALLDGDFGTALRTISAAVGGEKAEPEAQAYLLLWSCLKKSLVRIFHAHFYEQAQREVLVFEHEQQFSQDLRQELPKMELHIDRAFVQNPMQHPSTEALHTYLRDWMRKDLQLSDDEARRATALFPRYLLQEMAMTGRKDYQQLYEHLESPFSEAETKAAAIDAYQARLRREFFRPAFTDERVTLADMYVQPYFRYFKPKKEEKDEADEREGHFVRPKPKYHLIELAQDWLSGNCNKHIPNADARILLLLGQPGQGKSSFTRYLAWHLLSENSGLVDKVFLIRLRDLGDKYKLIEAPLEDLTHYLQEYPLASITFEKTDFKNSLLVLDGLDEFYMNNGLGPDDVEKFLKNLKRDIELECTQRNPANPIKCLITSRSNYVKLEVDNSRDLLIAEIDLMSKEEQLEWLSRFENSLSPEAEGATQKRGFIEQLRKDLQTINTENGYVKIKTLVNQPILLQIVVEAEASPIQSKDRVSLYERMFDYLIQRKWVAEKNAQLASLKPLVEEEHGTYYFRRFLQAFALLIFYKEKEYALRSDFMQEPLQAAFKDLQSIFEGSNPDSLVKNLLISFYFKEVVREKEEYPDPQDRSNNAYEFLHKSFQEYLIAEYIWSYFKELLTEKNKRGEYVIKEEDAMKQVFELFAPRLLTYEITDYLYEFVLREENLDPAVFERTTSIMHGLAEHSYLLEYDWKKEKQNRKRSTPLEQSLAVFYGLLSVNGAIVAQKTKDVDWPGALDEDYKSKREALAAPLQFLPNTRLSADMLILLRRNYSYEAKLYLVGADLSGASLIGADLFEANLKGTDLRRTNLSRAALIGVNLSGANINESDLSGASFFRANLRGVSLYKADLRAAFFSETDLREAYLFEADIAIASFSGADLSRADLTATELYKVEFYSTDLSGSDLSSATLNGAKFCEANLIQADFKNTVLLETIFGPDRLFGPAQNLNQVQNLHLAKNLEEADWHGTIYEGYTAEDWARFRKEGAGQEEV